MSLLMTRYSNMGFSVTNWNYIVAGLPRSHWLAVSDSDETPVSQGRFGANFTSDVGMQPLNDASYVAGTAKYGKSYVAQSNAKYVPSSAVTLYDKYIKTIARLDTVNLSDRTCEVKLNRNRLWRSNWGGGSHPALPSGDYDTDGEPTSGTYYTDTLWDINFDKDTNFSFVTVRVYLPLDCTDPDNFPLFKVELFDTIYSVSTPLQTWNYPSDIYSITDDIPMHWLKYNHALDARFQISDDNLRLMGNRWQNPSLKLTLFPEGGWIAGAPKFVTPSEAYTDPSTGSVFDSWSRTPSMLPDATITATTMNTTGYDDSGNTSSTTNLHDPCIVMITTSSTGIYAWGAWVSMHPVLDSSSNPQPSKFEVGFEKPNSCPIGGDHYRVEGGEGNKAILYSPEGSDQWTSGLSGDGKYSEVGSKACWNTSAHAWNHYQAVPAYTFWDDKVDFKGLCFTVSNFKWSTIGDKEFKVSLIAYSGQSEERVICTRYRKASVTNPYNAEFQMQSTMYSDMYTCWVTTQSDYDPITKAEWMKDATTDMTYDEQDNLSVRFELSGFDFTVVSIPGGYQYVDTPIAVKNVLLFMQPTSTMSFKFGGSGQAFSTAGDEVNKRLRLRWADATYLNVSQTWMDDFPNAEVAE